MSMGETTWTAMSQRVSSGWIVGVKPGRTVRKAIIYSADSLFANISLFNNQQTAVAAGWQGRKVLKALLTRRGDNKEDYNMEKIELKFGLTYFMTKVWTGEMIN